MKLLVFSDSHGNVANMEDAVRREEPDQVLHLGDVVRDADALRRRFPDLPMTRVRGNCDARSDVPEECLLERAGRRLLLMHGAHPLCEKRVRRRGWRLPGRQGRTCCCSATPMTRYATCRETCGF